MRGVVQVRLCVCVIRGTLSSCRSAAESECGFGQVRLCVCVCVVRLMLVVVGLPERVSVSCWAGLSVCVCVCVCVLRRILSSRLSAGESECVALCRSVCVWVCHMRIAE